MFVWRKVFVFRSSAIWYARFSMVHVFFDEPSKNLTSLWRTSTQCQIMALMMGLYGNSVCWHRGVCWVVAWSKCHTRIKDWFQFSGRTAGRKLSGFGSMAERLERASMFQMLSLATEKTWAALESEIPECVLNHCTCRVSQVATCTNLCNLWGFARIRVV